METERVTPDLPRTTPFRAAPGGAERPPLFCASPPHGLPSIDALVSASSTAEDPQAVVGPLYSADAKTEQAFFGNFLPVSSSLRCGFMRRCPSVPSELSAADQQRLLQQQRLHVHLLQLERKVSMQERLLCEVQKSGEAPTLLQQHLAAAPTTESAGDVHNNTQLQGLQFLSKKREFDTNFSGFLPSLHQAVLGNRSLALAELPSLSLFTQHSNLSVGGSTDGSKSVGGRAASHLKVKGAEADVFGAVAVKTGAADPITPSTAVTTVIDSSPSSDKREEPAATSANNSETRSEVTDAAAVSVVETSLESACVSSVKVEKCEDSVITAGLRSEQAAASATPDVLKREFAATAEEEDGARAARLPSLPPPLAAACGKSDRPGALEGQAQTQRRITGVRLQQQQELQLQQQPSRTKRGKSAVETHERSEEQEKGNLREISAPQKKTPPQLKKGYKGTNAQIGRSLSFQTTATERPDREGIASATAGKRLEGARPFDQFFRRMLQGNKLLHFTAETQRILNPLDEQRDLEFHIKLCAKYLRQACKRGSRCSYAHAEEELREIPNLWKTKLCATHKLGKLCPLETGCTFAHGEEELRCTPDYYKTKLCKFWMREGRCEAGEGCRHAHGAAELRQRTYRYDEHVKADTRVSRQAHQRVMEAPSNVSATNPKRKPLSEMQPVPPALSPGGSIPASGKRPGAVVPQAEAKRDKVEEEKGLCVRYDCKSRSSLKTRGPTRNRLASAKNGSSPIEGEARSGRRKNDVAQGGDSAFVHRSNSWIRKRGRGERERQSSGKGGIAIVGQAKERSKRGEARSGGGMRSSESMTKVSILNKGERIACAAGTHAQAYRPNASRKNSCVKDTWGRPPRGPVYQQPHRGGGRGWGRGERGESSVASTTTTTNDQRRSTFCSHGTQHASYSRGSGNTNMRGCCFSGVPDVLDQVERAAHQSQHAHVQHQQQGRVTSHPEMPIHVAEPSALDVTGAAASTLYGLAADINPYGALAACQQQGPYGLSLLSPGPPSCGDMQAAAAAAAAVAAIAQQQQQLEAAAKAVGNTVYQNMPFLGPSPYSAFASSTLSYPAPARALPSFAGGPVGAGCTPAGRPCGPAYAAAAPYRAYPYSPPGAQSLLLEPNGGGAAGCIPSTYNSQGIPVTCAACNYDSDGPEASVPSNRRHPLQMEVREAGLARGGYPSQEGERLLAAVHPAGSRQSESSSYPGRMPPSHHPRGFEEGSCRCNKAEGCGTYPEVSAAQ